MNFQVNPKKLCLLSKAHIGKFQVAMAMKDWQGKHQKLQQSFIELKQEAVKERSRKQRVGSERKAATFTHRVERAASSRPSIAFAKKPGQRTASILYRIIYQRIKNCRREIAVCGRRNSKNRQPARGRKCRGGKSIFLLPSSPANVPAGYKNKAQKPKLTRDFERRLVSEYD